jgi:hypothetical protein
MSKSLFGVWLVLSTNALAQCVLEPPIRVDGIEGRIVFGSYNRSSGWTVNRVVDKGDIRLVDWENPKIVVASTTVDKDGSFRIPDVKPGKYVISVRHEALVPVLFEVTLTKPKGFPVKRPIFLVLDTGSTRECGDDSVQVRPKAEVDRMLSAASQPAQ